MARAAAGVHMLCRPAHFEFNVPPMRRRIRWTTRLPKASLAQAQGTRPAPELSVVVSTYNERSNVPLLLERLDAHSPASTGK